LGLLRKNKAAELIGDDTPEKIVIVTGPTFGSVVGFIALGAALGAAGVLYWKERGSTPGLTNDDTVPDPFSKSVNAREKTALVHRANALMQRVKSLSVRARDTIESARETLAPTIQEAITEAKTAAAQTEHELHDQLDENAKEN
jgi:hypothetical protein